MFHWTPAVFWTATAHEFMAALDGHNRFHGGPETAKREEFAAFKRDVEQGISKT